MSYPFGPNDLSQNPVTRPRCWGKETQYNPNLRECQSCPFQASCGEDITRQRRAVHPVPSPTWPSAPQGFTTPAAQPPPMFPTFPSQPQQQQPLARYGVNPVAQVPQAPPPPPQPMQIQQFRPSPQQPQTQAMVVSQMPPSHGIDWYGRVQDPMFYPIMTAPPLFRPQMQGETFIERLFKNMALSAGEMAAAHLLLFMRQTAWPPKPPNSNG